MTTPIPEAIEAALKAQYLALDRGANGETALIAALAAVDAAMEAAGYVRVPVYTQADLDAAEREAEQLAAAFEEPNDAMIAARPSANKGERG